MKRKASTSKKQQPTKKSKMEVIPKGNLLRGTPEIKYFDARFTINIAPTWVFNHIVNMQQGNTATTRVGSRIRIISIDVRGTHVLDNQTGAVNPIQGDILRACLVQDTQSNGLIVSGVDVFSVNAMNEFQLLTTNSRFIRLKDVMGSPISSGNYVAATGSSIEMTQINMHYSFKKIDVEFIQNSGDYTGVGKNGIWLAVCGFTGASSYDCTTRLRYVDF